VATKGRRGTQRSYDGAPVGEHRSLDRQEESVKRLIILVASLAIAAGLTTACGSSSSSHPTTPDSSSSAVFPVTVNAANGAVTIPARPTRVMSLSASATSMLYDIGAGPQVVAVDKYSADPPNAPRTGLTGFETGPESYVPFHPDLVVLAQDETGKIASELAGLGIPTLILSPATTIADTYSQITMLGKATGHESAAAAENSSIRSRLEAIVPSVGSRGRGATYYQELDPTLYTATSNTFIGSLYKSLGMVNIADPASSGGNDYPQLSTESLIEANPDYVFLADGDCCGQSAATFGKRSGYSTMRAVRLHHVFNIPDSIASEWGPRVVVFLQMVAHDLTSS